MQLRQKNVIPTQPLSILEALQILIAHLSNCGERFLEQFDQRVTNNRWQPERLSFPSYGITFGPHCGDTIQVWNVYKADIVGVTLTCQNVHWLRHADDLNE